MMHAQFDQPVKALAVDQRFEVAADADIGRRLARVRVADHAYRRLRSGDHGVVKVGQKRQILRLTFARDLEINGNERRVLHPDADLFDRGDKEIFIALADQN